MGLGLDRGLYKGIDSRTTAIPLLMYDNQYIHMFGNVLDVKLLSAETVQVVWRTKYELGGGYKASDSPFLTGMAERKGRLWLGAAATWETSLIRISAQWMKAAAASKGQQLQLRGEHTFRSGHFQLIPYLGVEWLDEKYVDYNFGVKPEEAMAGRSLYVGAATTEISGGLRINYGVTRNQLVMVDIGAKHRGAGISDSPLVDRATTSALRLGYLYQF
nr:MipA/OmpV family protein [Pseudoduganella danionis]